MGNNSFSTIRPKTAVPMTLAKNTETFAGFTISRLCFSNTHIVSESVIFGFNYSLGRYQMDKLNKKPIDLNYPGESQRFAGS